MLRGVALTAGIGLGLLVACHSSSPTYSNEQLEQKTAQATEALKQHSKEALKNARIAAGKAEQKVNAVTSGVKKGIQSKPAGESAPIDINTASTAELASLPGISSVKANEIAKHRPYGSPHELVERGLLSEKQYEAVSSKISTH